MKRIISLCLCAFISLTSMSLHADWKELWNGTIPDAATLKNSYDKDTLRLEIKPVVTEKKTATEGNTTTEGKVRTDFIDIHLRKIIADTGKVESLYKQEKVEYGANILKEVAELEAQKVHYLPGRGIIFDDFKSSLPVEIVLPENVIGLETFKTTGDFRCHAGLITARNPAINIEGSCVLYAKSGTILHDYNGIYDIANSALSVSGDLEFISPDHDVQIYGLNLDVEGNCRFESRDVILDFATRLPQNLVKTRVDINGNIDLILSGHLKARLVHFEVKGGMSTDVSELISHAMGVHANDIKLKSSGSIYINGQINDANALLINLPIVPAEL